MAAVQTPFVKKLQTIFQETYYTILKYKNEIIFVSSSIREYAQQLKYNLEIEKQISTVTDSQNKFQQKWCKILHAL